MYFLKAPNAAGSKISVTTTATGIFDLINTAASTTDINAGYPSTANAIIIQPEDGDVRVLFDGNTPTSTNGYLISSGTNAQFSNVPLSSMQLISTTGTVVCSVMVGYAKAGENVVVSGTGGGGSVTIVSSDGTWSPLDNGSQTLKNTTQNPIYTHHGALLQVDVTNETNATTNRYFDVTGYDVLLVQFEKTGGADSVTFTIEASCEDNGTAASSAVYQDISQYGVESLTAAAGAASYTADVTLRVNVKGIKYINLKTVSAGGANDADYSLLARVAY